MDKRLSERKLRYKSYTTTPPKNFLCKIRFSIATTHPCILKKFLLKGYPDVPAPLVEPQVNSG